MRIFYNDIDRNACAWLRELISDGLLPPGDVDARSILEIQPHELREYDQVHLFAGIGGWPYALQLAGFDAPCWTGSCPCQPLSCAGQGKGHADERHLWPAFYALIAQCRPPAVFGEQVASKLGREWFSGVRADLEGAGYACGAANLPAASVGAPHKRERLFWVAQSGGGRFMDTIEPSEPRKGVEQEKPAGSGCGVANSHSRGRGARSGEQGQCGTLDAGGERVADAEREGSQGQPRDEHNGHEPGRERTEAPRPTPEGGDGSVGNPHAGRQQEQREPQHRDEQRQSGILPDRPGARGFWDGAQAIQCLDGKARRIEPGIPPLAHGIPGRVALLRGAGNAIVPQAAQAFIQAFTETLT